MALWIHPLFRPPTHASSKPTAALLAGLALASASVGAQTPSTIERSLRLEAEGDALLLQHHAAEKALTAPDQRRLSVFLSAEAGAPLLLEEAQLWLDGKVVARHRHQDSESARLLGGAVQALYLGAIDEGEHGLRVEIKTRQGKVAAMSEFRFLKGASPRFVELRLGAGPTRSIRASAW